MHHTCDAHIEEGGKKGGSITCMHAHKEGLLVDRGKVLDPGGTF